MRTQRERLLAYLKANKTITAEQALAHLGIARLAARVLEIRDQGADIHVESINVLNRYGEPIKVARYHFLGMKAEAAA